MHTSKLTCHRFPLNGPRDVGKVVFLNEPIVFVHIFRNQVCNFALVEVLDPLLSKPLQSLCEHRLLKDGTDRIGPVSVSKKKGPSISFSEVFQLTALEPALEFGDLVSVLGQFNDRFQDNRKIECPETLEGVA